MMTYNTIAIVLVCNDYYIIAYLLVGEQDSSLFFNGDVQPLFTVSHVGSDGKRKETNKNG